MLKSEQITSIFKGLDSESGKFKFRFNSLIKLLFRFQENSPDLQEECLRLFFNYDTVFQVDIIDIDYSFHVKIRDGIMTFGKGHYHESTLPVTRLEMSKEILLQILQQQVNIESLYNKGHVKLRGSLAQLVRFRSLGRYYMKYINKVFRNTVS